MTRPLAAGLALVAAIAAGVAPASATPVHPKLRGVDTFALAIGDGVLDGPPPRLAGRLAGYDLVVLDGQEATAADVRALRRRGARVLAYLSVGTIERPRPWFPAARRYRLELWQQWGEWYADTSAPGFRRLIARRVAPAMLRKGFHGLFLDNADMVEAHPRQARGMRALVAQLGRLVQRRRAVLAAQNGDRSVGRIARHLHAWNREDASFTFDGSNEAYRAATPAERREATTALRRMARRGILTTTTDYTVAGDGGAAAAASRRACAAGAVPYVSDVDLRRIPQPPPRCAERGPAAGDLG